MKESIPGDVLEEGEFKEEEDREHNASGEDEVIISADESDKEDETEHTTDSSRRDRIGGWWYSTFSAPQTSWLGQIQVGRQQPLTSEYCHCDVLTKFFF